VYFVVMTITSVGYGDITATTFNPTEQFVFVGIMLCTGMLWGYLIGIFCALASPSATVQEFRSDLSGLNDFMASHKVSPLTRFRLREFMHQTVHLKVMEGRQRLLGKLSPAMQGEMSLLINQRTILRVWYLANAETGLLIDLASKLKPLVFPPSEFCPSGFLYIVDKGTAIYAAQVRHQGSTWGDDVILNRPELELEFPAVPVSYLWVFTVTGEDIRLAVQNFPASKVVMDRIRKRWILRRAIVRYAEQTCYKAGRLFRGRNLPVYAKQIARQLEAEARVKDHLCSQRPTGSTGMTLLSPPPAMKTHINLAASPSPDKKAAPLAGSSRLRLLSPSRRPSLLNAKQANSCEAARRAAADYGMQLRQVMMAATSNRRSPTELAIAGLQTDVLSLQSTSIGLQSEMSQLRSDMREVLVLLRESRPAPLSRNDAVQAKAVPPDAVRPDFVRPDFVQTAASSPSPGPSPGPSLQA